MYRREYRWGLGIVVKYCLMHTENIDLYSSQDILISITIGDGAYCVAVPHVGTRGSCSLHGLTVGGILLVGDGATRNVDIGKYCTGV